MEFSEYITAVQNSRELHSKQEVLKNKVKQRQQRQLLSSMHYQEDVIINNYLQPCVISPTRGNSHIYNIEAMPYETFDLGSYVRWKDRLWLITTKQVDDSLHAIGEITLCNQEFKFQTFDGKIKSYYGFISSESGSKTGDASVKVRNPEGTLTAQLPYNDDTKQLYINKRMVLWTEYNAQGEIIPSVYKIVEVRYNSSDSLPNTIVHLFMEKDTYGENDSIELMIADYVEPTPKLINKFYNKAKIDTKPNIKIGNIKRTLKPLFYDKNDKLVTEYITPLWTVETDIKQLHQTNDGDNLVLWLDNDNSLIGTFITVSLTDKDNTFIKDTISLEVI